MKMIIQQNLLPKGHMNRSGYPMTPEGVIFHATSNYSKGAGDELHVKYLLYTAKNKSWHVTVDHDSVTQHIPFNENAWAAGDGANGRYNRRWIHVEIACNQTTPGKPLDKPTYDNAVGVLAQIVKQFNFPFDKLQPHEVVYGKNCPQETLFDRTQFKKDVFNLVHAEPKDGYPEDTPQWKKDRVNWMFEQGLLDSEEWKMKLEEPLPLWAIADILMDFKKGGK